MIYIPEHFYATNKLGEKYEYKLIEAKEGFRGIRLLQVCTQTDTCVESEWFDYRKIEEIPA